MHSTLSDGGLSVRELIDYCVAQGLSAIAITDHDNIDSYEEGREYAEEAGIEYIPGVEISSYWNGSDIHILGYCYEPTHLRLNRTLIALRERRRIRAREIVRRLSERGVELSYEKLEQKTRHGSIGRAHIAAALVEEEYVPTFQDAFTRYLGTDNKLMEGIESEKLTPEEAIQLILDAGGVPVMAHPSKTNRDDLIPMLVDHGLKGIELYCHGHSTSCFHRYKDMAKRYGLLHGGGADFHVKREDARYSPGSLRIPYEILEKVRDARDRVCVN
jgi:predicted metal-dependent phosphoesterase TrpH